MALQRKRMKKTLNMRFWRSRGLVPIWKKVKPTSTALRTCTQILEYMYGGLRHWFSSILVVSSRVCVSTDALHSDASPSPSSPWAGPAFPSSPWAGPASPPVLSPICRTSSAASGDAAQCAAQLAPRSLVRASTRRRPSRG